MSIYRLCIPLFMALSFAPSSAFAHEDIIAPLARVERVYATPKPIGKLRVTYSEAESGKEPSLAVECDLFRGSVPAKGLGDLPRPDWDQFYAAYSLTSYVSGKSTDRPYVYIQVPLRGPAAKAWERTWVTFHFDADGKLVREIKRFISDIGTNTTRVVWKEWKIGSSVSAEALLEAAKDQ